jgi:hypothetical protein
MQNPKIKKSLCLIKRHAIQMREGEGLVSSPILNLDNRCERSDWNHTLKPHYMKFHVLNISGLINLLAGSLSAIQYFYSCWKSN